MEMEMGRIALHNETRERKITLLINILTKTQYLNRFSKAYIVQAGLPGILEDAGNALPHLAREHSLCSSLPDNRHLHCL